MRQIIRLTGPIDLQPDLSQDERILVNFYVAFARTDLIRGLLEQSQDDSEFGRRRLESTKAAADELYRHYLSHRKKILRNRRRF